MAAVQIVYWHHIPTQVKAKDQAGQVKKMLPERFMAAVDQSALDNGLAGTDAYLNGWRSGEWQEREGDAESAAQAAVDELVQQHEGKAIPLELDP